MSALRGFRILELAESVAGEYCGKLLADLDADVIKVERPGRGSPTRALAPRLADGGPDSGVVFAYLNTNKRSAELDVTCDAATLHALIGGADAVIDDHDEQWAEAAGVTENQIAARHPATVFCSVTPYGRGASADRRSARSLNVFHSSGWGYHTPSHADPTRPPLKGPGCYLADYEAGLDAALCVAAALFGRMHTGAGEFIDVSQHAVLVSRADCILGRFITGEIAPQDTRDDYDQAGPASFFGCRDGHVYLYMTSRAHWLGLKALLGRPDWLDEFDDDWLEFGVTPAKVAAFRRGFAEWVGDRPRDATAEEAQRHGVPLVAVNGAAELTRAPQYRHRGFFRDVSHPVLGRAGYPTVGYRMSASPVDIASAAPRLGQHTADVLRDLAAFHTPPAVAYPQLKTPKRHRGGPLQGVRVLELTKVWAGPYAGKLLGFLGAEVIKVESSQRPEEMRAYGGTDINHAPYFLSINPEILSVDLDIRTNRDRLRELISRFDIVINNLRPGAMERQGLSHAELVAIKPDIISVSIKMWGNDGPLGYQTGYAPCFAALAGLASLVGYPDGAPCGASMRYGDSTVGAAAAFSAMAALLHRERTGEGQFVDVSAVEVLSSMIGDRLLAQTLTGAALAPDGNRHPDMAPHGCYPCTDGQWISLAVADDAEWARLCDVLGAPALLTDARFATLPDRHRHVGALDAELAALTRSHGAEALARRLRAAGVGAAKSATATDVIGDEMLWERGAYLFVTDRVEGQRPVLGAPWRMTRNPARIQCGAPDLGQDNDYVLGEILEQPRVVIT